MRVVVVLSAWGLIMATATGSAAAAQPAGLEFAVSYPVSPSSVPLDGRVILLLSRDLTREPRTHVEANEPLAAPYLFGLNVEGMAPGSIAVLNDNAFGWPAAHLSAIPSGDYFAQAVLNRYETFHLADGRTLKLPPDKGEGQQWAKKPGNLFSTPLKVHLDASHPERIALMLDQQIEAISPKTDSEFIRHIRIRSELLSHFWGRDVFIGAHILVPRGFDAHPQAHYPVMVFHGHYPDDISGFRTTPPDAHLTPDYSERFHLSGYNRIQQKEAYAFYRKWISADFPRFLVVEIEHANPYYDDSYAVNSANLGPYGDAIETELIPAIEKQFRGIGQGWARFAYGGSTGGWESLAVQIFYPDHYNGVFVACPDPVDFRAYTTINIYSDPNAFYMLGPHTKIAQPALRDYLGRTLGTVQGMNQYELALGSHARSGEQFDIWQAVYGPVGDDGYPKQIFNKETGDIDRSVAAYWKEHYDLSAVMQREWATLGPKLQGKLHIYVGSADTYFLNDAVYYLEDFLRSTKNPPYDGEVKYGDRAEHCWNGDPNLPNYLSRLHYNTMYLPKIMERIQKTAPADADMSWKY